MHHEDRGLPVGPFLAGCVAIDVPSFALMSNYYHVILRNRPNSVDGWSDTEVAATGGCSAWFARRPMATLNRWFMNMVPPSIARLAKSVDGYPDVHTGTASDVSP